VPRVTTWAYLFVPPVYQYLAERLGRYPRFCIFTGHTRVGSKFKSVPPSESSIILAAPILIDNMEQTLEKCIQIKDIKYLLKKLADKYDPLQIYCFHKEEKSTKTEGCFTERKNTEYCDYWLLMVAESASRIESAVQDFANAHYEFGRITLLAHGKESIEKSIDNGFMFFANVYRYGKLMYNRQLSVTVVVTNYFVSAGYSQTLQQRFGDGISKAEGFLHGAIECLSSRKYNICIFMLHQAVEQCCIALIGRHMDYRCDSHNLQRLLMLCRCFSEEPYQLFISGNKEERVVFEKLLKSYSNARYAADFSVEELEVKLLIDKVSKLIGQYLQ
jgi:HEPN domain-containing protein